MPEPATRPAWAAAAADLARRDEVHARLLERHGPPDLRPGAAARNRFAAVASAIAHQQLAGRAAAAIWGRVVATVGEPVTPEAVLRAGPTALRAAGLSGAKTASLLDLATRCAEGTVRLERIGRLDDEAVIEHLTVVRGIGRWTAQMFLLFDLRRLDVWPTGDLGVRVGYARANGLDSPPNPNELDALGEAAAPYRSVLAWWCWREADTVTPR